MASNSSMAQAQQIIAITQVAQSLSADAVEHLREAITDALDTAWLEGLDANEMGKRLQRVREALVELPNG